MAFILKEDQNAKMRGDLEVIFAYSDRWLDSLRHRGEDYWLGRLQRNHSAVWQEMKRELNTENSFFYLEKGVLTLKVEYMDSFHIYYKEFDKRKKRDVCYLVAPSYKEVKGGFTIPLETEGEKFLSEVQQGLLSLVHTDNPWYEQKTKMVGGYPTIGKVSLLSRKGGGELTAMLLLSSEAMAFVKKRYECDFHSTVTSVFLPFKDAKITRELSPEQQESHQKKCDEINERNLRISEKLNKEQFPPRKQPPLVSIQNGGGLGRNNEDKEDEVAWGWGWYDKK